MTIRVVIADDQPDVRAALGDVIRSEPSLELVGVAEDTEQTVELVREHRPDVAVVDVKMPGGGGPCAVEGIRSYSPETRVVALSAYEDRESVFQMLRAGAVAYLVKGAPAEEILETIQRSTRGEAVLSSEVTAEVVHELVEQLERQESEAELQRERLARIRRALGKNALTMVFQPIVELESGRPVGYEALARFTLDPPRSPDLWFAEAEEVGMHVDLELAALRAALGRLDDLPDGAYLTVNVSPQALLARSVLAALSEVSVERIVLETTEHAQIADYDALNEALREFRTRGGGLAIDDAGAGFASLRHVLRLAPDIVKLDGSLIRGIETERGARALASALISFAEEMDQVIVAEGIETGRAVEILLALGVPYGQGYYLAGPGDLPGRQAITGDRAAAP